MTARAEIGVIGGSGFYALDALADPERVEVETPYGPASAPFVLGTLRGRRVAFLARHGEGHTLLPAEVPAHANIHAFKQLGVTRVLAASAVGSLQSHIAPGHAVVPDQLIDRTRGRSSTFFGDGLVAHIGFADPFCPDLSRTLGRAASERGVTAHEGGALVVIEGPAFSTRAESELYRSWRAAIIGMTALPEAKLAREAELCYAALCFATDYDVWHSQEEDVSAELIMRTLQENTERARATLEAAVAALGDERACDCGEALAGALVTAPGLVPAETRRRLAPLVERYWGPVEAGAPAAGGGP
jgi:5'-methylthioadenosine phosphorylase